MISTLRLQQSPLVPPSPPFSLCSCWPTTRLLIKRNNAGPAPPHPPPCLLLTYFSWIGDNDNFRTFLGWQGGMKRGGGDTERGVRLWCCQEQLELLGELCA